MSNTGSERLENAKTDANGDSDICADCDRRFLEKRGLNQHLRSCYLKNKITEIQTSYEKNKDDANAQTSDDSNNEIPDISTPSLRHKLGSYQDCLFERISRLRKNSILEERSIFIAIWTSRKEFQRWNFQTDERVDTRFAIKSCRF